MALDPNLENINITDFTGDRIHIPGAGSQIFFRPKAKWEPCDCEKNLQRGRRCIKEETRCTDVTRNCPIGSCSDTTAGPSTISPQSPLLTPTAPEMDTSQSSVVLGAALGGVAFVLLAVVFVVVVIYRKKARSKGAGRNSSCLPCSQPRQGSPPTSNPNYYPPEILHGPRDQRLANATNNNAANKGDPASYYNTDLANHFYETVATIPRRSNNDDLPPIPTVDSQTNSSTAVSQNQDSAQNASGADQGYEIPKPHYLELVDDPDYYNRLGVAQPSPTAPPQDRGYAKLPFKSTNEYHVLEKEYTNTP